MSTTKEIIDAARSEYLDDIILPYLWSNEELLRALNEALNEWTKETLCLQDSSTEAICKILLLSNQYTYDMDSRIVLIRRGRLVTGYPHLNIRDEPWMNDNLFAWETRTGTPCHIIPDYESGKLRTVPYFNTDGYFSGTMTADDVTKTFTLAGQGFSTYLAVGNQVDIAGTLNDGVFTVASVAADSFTVDEAVQTETVATVVRKVRDTLLLSVTRLPLSQLTIGAWQTQSPEIVSTDHNKLISGILRKAYLKRDSQTFDPKAAETHRLLFERDKGKAKTARDRLRHPAQILRPDAGTV